MNPLSTANVFDKLKAVQGSAQTLLESPQSFHIPAIIARDIEVVWANQMPAKKGLISVQGQARLVHDLASIELQAMELGIRSLIEFPEAPRAFREQLLEVTLSEAEHFKKCLQALESLGHKWGDWNVHTALWQAVSAEDSLLDRVLIVHRYLEGSGLDAGDTLLRRLWGLSEGPLHQIVRMIVKDEIGHVEFGSKWYHQLCQQDKIDPQQDFSQRMEKIRWKVPKRVEPVSRRLRSAAGFTDFEIDFLEKFREKMMPQLATKPKSEEFAWNQRHLEDLVPLKKSPLPLG